MMRTLILLLIPIFLFAGDYKKTTYTKNGKFCYAIVQTQDEQTIEIPGRDVFDVGQCDFESAAKKLIEITGGKIPIVGKNGKITIVDVNKVSAKTGIEQVSVMLEIDYGKKVKPGIVEPDAVEIKKKGD